MERRPRGEEATWRGSGGGPDETQPASAKTHEYGGCSRAHPSLSASQPPLLTDTMEPGPAVPAYHPSPRSLLTCRTLTPRRGLVPYFRRLERQR